MIEAIARSLVDEYVAAWNERDNNKRAEILRAICSPIVLLFDPALCVCTPTAIAEFIGEQQQKLGYERVALTTKVELHEHGNFVRFGWGLWQPAACEPNVHGMDYVEFNSRAAILKVVSFLQG